MPDKRKHRGPNPQDATLFAPERLADLRLAVSDLSMLLTKGYAQTSSLKLVGDRFALTERQRTAVKRSACSDSQLAIRKEKHIPPGDLNDKTIIIDGYNILITIESLLSGSPVLVARDGCVRDIAGIHGTYRTVEETIPAFELIADTLNRLEVAHVLWLFDSPVSNSGKLKTLVYELAGKNDWPWDVELLTNPDTEMIATDKIIVTADSDVLDKCTHFSNLTAYIIDKLETSANIIDLSNRDF
jgi:hypothetical protein